MQYLPILYTDRLRVMKKDLKVRNTHQFLVDGVECMAPASAVSVTTPQSLPLPLSPELALAVLSKLSRSLAGRELSSFGRCLSGCVYL